MNVTKKYDRFKQWAGERMGGEIKTNVSDNFKALETEMTLRQEGLDKMQRSTNAYIKGISKRSEVEGKEKILPIAQMGGTMISHGDDFDTDSELGQCLHLFGRTQERLARTEENYITGATSSWLESLERSLVQMKEYQGARKKLETRRLGFDTSLAKLQRAKKEDFRAEEELRSQKAKYEEAEDDVHRRMEEIREMDPETVADIGSFLDAQLAYHEQSREALLQLKADWPVSAQGRRPTPRSRSNTTRSYAYETVEELPPPIERPSIKSNRTVSGRAGDHSTYEPDRTNSPRPGFNRSTTYDAPAMMRRDMSPVGSRPLSRVPSDTLMVRTARSNLRTVDRPHEGDVFGDDSASNSSPDLSYGDASTSPSTSVGSSAVGLAKRGPPPPPPSRAKKPPPPVPQKRTVFT